MSDAAWVAISTVLMSLINTIGACILQWIRAKYKVSVTNGGQHNGSNLQPPHR